MRQQRSSMAGGWRPARAVGAALAAALLLASCGGGAGDEGAAERAGALATARPGELLVYVKGKLAQRQALRQARPGLAFDSAAPPLIVSAEASGAPLLRSATTVQEAGVDEDDTLKTDGALLYTLDAQGRNAAGEPVTTLAASRRLADGGIERSATLALPAEPQAWPVAHGMLLAEAARRIAVLGETVTLAGGVIDPCAAVDGCLGGPALMPMPMIASTRVQVQLVDAATDGSLAAATRHSLEGRLIGSRLIGNALVVVTSHAPVLAVETLPADATGAERNATIDALTVSDLLPTRSVDGGATTALVAETDCYLQPANASPGIEITTISVFDLGAPDAAPKSRCIVGGSEAVYMSAASLVLATTRHDYRSEQTGDVVTIYPAEISTDLHKFALEDAGPAYRGSATVAGHLGWDDARKPYRISEHQGDLRVLTFTGETGWTVAEDAGNTPASPATLTVLRERTDGGGLATLSTLPNPERPAPIGKPGEQVYAVRFVGDRGYVVTFRQVDPLMVIDLADAADPKIAGALEVPGFSDHLFPLDGGLLFGVGRQADENGVLGGVKVALFDVRNPAQPTLVAEQSFGAHGSATALDATPHGINWLAVGAKARIALPMQLWSESGESQQGLQRFEVDTAARTLAAKTMIPATPSDLGHGLFDERSVQIGGQVYYLSGGTLSAWNW